MLIANVEMKMPVSQGINCGPRKARVSQKKIWTRVNGVAGFGAQHTSCIGICRNVVGLCLIMILNILPFTVLYFFSGH